MDPDLRPANPDYDFILDPNQPAPKKRLFPVGNSKISRLIMLVGGGVLLLIVIIVVASTVFGGGKATSSMVGLVEEQQELIRIAGIGTEKATDPSTKSFAYIAKLSVLSDQQALTAYLKKNDVKVSDKQLALKKNNQTDTTLNNAAQSNQFDTTFMTTLKTQLMTYQQNVKKAFDASANPASRTLLSKTNDGLSVLLK